MVAPRPGPGPKPFFPPPIRRDSLESAPNASIYSTPLGLAPTLTRPEPARSISNQSDVSGRDRFADSEEVETDAAYGGTAGSARPGLRPIQLVNSREGGRGAGVEPFQPQGGGSGRGLFGQGNSRRHSRPGGWQRFFNNGAGSSTTGSEDDHSSSWHQLGRMNEKNGEKSGKKGEFEWSFENVPDTGDGKNHRYYLNGESGKASGGAIWVVDDQSPILAKGYFYLLNKSIITRWFLYIFPVLVLLWIPGIVWLAGLRDAKIWTVNLLWWSIWFSVVWGGWWAALAASMMLPRVLQNTIVTVVPSLRFWVDVIKQLVRNIAFIFWAMANWISFTPLIINHYTGDPTAGSRSSLSTFVNLLFGLFLCTLVIGGEKLIVQLIAYRFHQESYEDRIREQKLQIRSLVTLYINSHDIPGRRDTLTENSFGSRDPRKAIKKALKGLKNAAQTTTTALGNVATEISGQSVLQTNSPYNRITAALASASKSKQLARRLYYSFKSDEHDYVVFKDIARYFPDEDAARVAFAVFDRDDNGDATRDEFEMACMQIHREKLAIEASLRDLDGAVRRLDDIFMVIVVLIIVLIMAAMVTNKLTTLVTSAGTFVLGLSWLIGTTMQEILGACIFLFVKHPFDVGDRVDIEDKQYVVASMQLMSTTLRRVDGTYTFIGNDQLRSKYIYNIRRSGPISETLLFEVDFATDFKKLVELRDKMLIFLNENRRDFMPVFDVVVDSFPDQGKLILKADIKYKTNWQEGALKVQRRNKWICALKNALADCRIYGPADAGNPAPAPADPVAYTLVPYVAPAPADTSSTGHPESPPPDFLAATTGAEHGAALLDQRQVLNDDGGDIFDDQADEDRTTATSTAHAANTPGLPYLRQRQARAQVPGENIEMAPTRARI